ncbi:MAG TPA: RICIN domain-containing protein [Polyangia bacterium]|nr:RICIN domain-containing protein [Polyangia bacterium]
MSGLCEDAHHCSTSGVPTRDGQPDGFSSCMGYRYVVTVWRNGAFKPVFDAAAQYAIKNVHSGKVIDWDQDSDAAQQWTNFSTGNQLWKFSQMGAGGYQIVSAANAGKCLTAVPMNADVSRVQMGSCDGSALQTWIVGTSNGRQPESFGQYFKFENAAQTDRYLEVPEQSVDDGTTLTADGFGPDDNELWRLSLVP